MFFHPRCNRKSFSTYGKYVRLTIIIQSKNHDTTVVNTESAYHYIKYVMGLDIGYGIIRCYLNSSSRRPKIYLYQYSNLMSNLNLICECWCLTLSFFFFTGFHEILCFCSLLVFYKQLELSSKGKFKLPILSS